jgi:CHAT domain-containing protein
LFIAGAQTQIASLWKVADRTTATLMVDYYQRLLNGDGRSAALREAQQKMLATPQRSHPYWWASFVPIGDWAPLTSKR